MFGRVMLVKARKMGLIFCPLGRYAPLCVEIKVAKRRVLILSTMVRYHFLWHQGDLLLNPDAL
jgi:hypothetical protein